MNKNCEVDETIQRIKQYVSEYDIILKVVIEIDIEDLGENITISAKGTCTTMFDNDYPSVCTEVGDFTKNEWLRDAPYDIKKRIIEEAIKKIEKYIKNLKDDLMK